MSSHNISHRCDVFSSSSFSREECDKLRATFQPGVPRPDQYLFDWCVHLAGSQGESGRCPQDVSLSAVY